MQESKRNKLLVIVKRFCKNTTMRGPKYMIGSKHKFLWILLFLIVVSVTTWQNIVNVLTYLKFGVKVAETHQIRSQLEFPSITFCPQYVWRKSPFSFLDLDTRTKLLTMFYLEDKKDRKKLEIENKRSCRNDQEEKINVLKMMSKFNIPLTISSMSSDTLIKLLTPHLGASFEYSIVKCIWKNTKLNCKDFFENHLSDTGGCFTFNPGSDVLNFLGESNGGSGMDIANYNESMFIVDSPMTGLELIFNVSQAEYCGNDVLKRGAGFYFQFHDKNAQTSFTLEPSIYLMPGYETSIMVKPVLHKRNTENLGLCANNVYLWMQPNAKVYRPSLCYFQCFTELVIKACHCYPPFFERIQETIVENMVRQGVNRSWVEICFGETVLCMKELQNQLLANESVNYFCPKCKPACIETKYGYQMSHLRLSLDHFNKAQNLSVRNYAELMKNYAVVKINFSSLLIEIIVENQAFTLKDLFIFIGGSICLFLGMSFLTLFELAHLVAEIFLLLFDCRKRSITSSNGQSHFPKKVCRIANCSFVKFKKMKIFSKKTKVAHQLVKTINVKEFKILSGNHYVN